MHESKIPAILSGLKNKLDNDEKIYWVCPTIDENDDIASVNNRFEHVLQMYENRCDNKVLLLHGRMNASTKQEIMDSFKHGPGCILVSTTVIEVGVDIPDATVIIIENAERFGLSQLHQLRGRVGRGSKQGVCILLYQHLSEHSIQRMNIMKNSNDGFEISEQDLKLRGGGDILGTRQSGEQHFRFIDIGQDYYLMRDMNDIDLAMIIDHSWISCVFKMFHKYPNAN
jgi:ATP-dependent DNA helicase RecG